MEPYLIKKYSSRRLYDVAAGHFVTLEEVDRLIRAGRHIKAVDSKGRDITRSILLQILTEREEGGEPLLSVDLLHEMVRLYGSVMQGPFGRYLEEGMSMLHKQRAAWERALPAAFRETATSASAAMGQLVGQQMDAWNRSQDAFLGLLGKSGGSSDEESSRKRRRPRAKPAEDPEEDPDED